MPIFSGKTINEAIENGLNHLGIDQDHAEIKTIQEPRKGFLGAFSRDAEVEIIVLTDSDLQKRGKIKKIKIASIFGGVILCLILISIFILNPNDTVNPPINSSDVKNEKVGIIKTQFEDAGFTEIKLEKINDKKNNGKVSSVTINKEKSFTKKSKYKTDDQVIITYFNVKNVVKSNKLTLKVNSEFTANEKGKVKISGLTSPGADVRIGMGILGDSTTADKHGKFTLRYNLSESSKDDDKITINASNNDKQKSAEVIIHQNPTIISKINEEEAKEKAEEAEQEKKIKAAEDYNSTHEAYEQQASDYRIIYLIDTVNKQIYRVSVYKSGKVDGTPDVTTYSGDMNSRIDFTFIFSDGTTYPMSAHYKYKDHNSHAIFNGESDGISNELENVTAYEVKKYFE